MYKCKVREIIVQINMLSTTRIHALATNECSSAILYIVHFSNKHTIEKMKKFKVDYYSKLHILYITAYLCEWRNTK